MTASVALLIRLRGLFGTTLVDTIIRSCLFSEDNHHWRALGDGEVLRVGGDGLAGITVRPPLAGMWWKRSGVPGVVSFLRPAGSGVAGWKTSDTALSPFAIFFYANPKIHFFENLIWFWLLPLAQLRFSVLSSVNSRFRQSPFIPLSRIQRDGERERERK